MRKLRRRLDAVELAWMSVLGSIVVLSALTTLTGRFACLPDVTFHDVAWLREKYGPHRYSQFEEEWIIRDFFKDRPGGFFVDVGANHYRDYSNTYYLEKTLGWSGIAIDANADFGPDYARHRPRTRFFAYFVSDTSGLNAQLHVLSENPLVSSSEKGFTDSWGKGARARSVPTITLDALLVGQEVRSVDLLSMDIELGEPKALAGFDVARFRPSLVCIEAHRAVVQQILDYFARHAYVIVGKYVRADTHNLYFTPLEPQPRPLQ